MKGSATKDVRRWSSVPSQQQRFQAQTLLGPVLDIHPADRRPLVAAQLAPAEAAVALHVEKGPMQERRGPRALCKAFGAM